MIIFLSQMTSSGIPPRGIHVRFLAPFNSSIACRIEHMTYGTYYDFDPKVQAFSSSPGTPFGQTTEMGSGVYSLDMLALSNVVFPPGEYCVSLHDPKLSYQAIGMHRVTLT